VPIDQATAGKLFRVRDRDWERVWAENLSWDEARKLVNTLTGSRKSKTARAEDMAIPAPDWFVSDSEVEIEITGDESPGLDQSVTLSAPASEPRRNANAPAPEIDGTVYDVASLEPVAVPSDGVVVKVPPGHELAVLRAATADVGWGWVHALLPASVTAGDQVKARPVDPYILAQQNAAIAAARVAMNAVKTAARPTYRDRTATAPAPPNPNPPRDKTVRREPAFVRLGAPPVAPPAKHASPLKVATIADGDAIPDEVLADDNIQDLALDIGGGPTDEDLEAAKRQRDREGRR
jgi:hypothetical protein